MSKFKDKFHLTPEQSLFLAKKKWNENGKQSSNFPANTDNCYT